MKTQRNFSALLSLLLALLILISACDRPLEEEFDTTPIERIQINNNSVALSNRVTTLNQEIGIRQDPFEVTTVAGPDLGTKNFISPKFDLKAEIPSPDKFTQNLSASFILIEGDYAFVSYHIRGATYGGGFEVLNIANPSSIQILSQVIYQDTDINAIAIDDEDNREGSAFSIYLAGANRKGALVERMRFVDGEIIAESNETLQLEGVNANGLIRTESLLYVTVGGRSGDGGLIAIDLRSGARNFTQIARDGFSDAKSIVAEDTKKNKKFYVLQGGSNAHIFKYKIQDDGIKKEKSYSIGSISTLDGKNSLSLRGDLLFAALSEKGVKVFDKDDIDDGEEFTASIANLGGSGLSNGITADEDHVYIANGKSGVFIADIPSKKEGFVVNGTLDMNGSANYVVANENVILIANGIGGVKAIARKPSEAELNLDGLNVVYQTFRKHGKDEFRGGRYGGADINNLKDPSKSQKNQIQIPIDELSTLNEIHLEMKADTNYKVYIYMAAEKGQYTEKLREYNVEKKAGYVKKSSIQLNKTGYKYVIISAVPNENGYGRAYLKGIQIKGLK